VDDDRWNTNGRVNDKVVNIFGEGDEKLDI